MIRRLDKNLSEFIKSQQYIQNTYTIVKELVENSLDAKSQIIKITVEKNQITVDDNGEGIENLENIGKEHYTSKELTSYSALGLVDQENGVLDNGYRGIALSAIRHLCDIEITSKYKNNDNAFKKTFINGNSNSNPEKSIRNQGTFIKIFNLFRDCKIRCVQNEKSLNKNIKMIKDLLESYACVYEVHFVFIFKGKQILNLKGFSSLNDFVDKKYNLHLKSSLLRDNKNFYFFLLPFTEDHPNQKIFLNKRVVSSVKITKTIKDTYNLFNEGKPTFFLNLKDTADYNLSPDKMEFIIKNEVEIIRTLKDEIRRFFRDQHYVESGVKNEGKEIVEEKGKEQSNFSILKDEEVNVKEKVNSPSESIALLNPHTPISSDTYQEMFKDITVIKNRSSSPENFEVENTLVSNSDKTFTASPIPSDSFSSPMLKNINLRLQTKNEQINKTREYLDSPKSEKYQEEDITVKLKDYGDEANIDYVNSTDLINTTSLELTTNAFSYLKFINTFTDNVHIIKSDFLEMKVIGQFNKGFILTSLVKDDKSLLLLIDQHAADEIYNYEILKATMKINKQKLLIPIKINLSPIDELYLNDKSIEKWGFEIKNNELVAVPQLGEVLFGVSDLMSIIENLKNDKCEFERLHDTYATKACRSSVMIGEGLSYSKMCSIIENLGRIVNPWKCPHGRPTFLILKDL